MSQSTMSHKPQRMPTYFLGIGGPNFMENTTHPAYSTLVDVGHEITSKVRPKAIVVFSAHWSEHADTIAVNVAEHTDLIYDFYNFPPHHYEYEYPNRGSPEIAERVIEKLTGSGIKVQRVKRGLDHGVWAGFIVAFNPQTNPLTIPIIQVSLYTNPDTQAHYRLGQSLQDLRGEGILIIGAGMAVHNLHDFRALRNRGLVADGPGLTPALEYTTTFDTALQSAVQPSNAQDRALRMEALMRRDDARKAHPTLEHILPMFVAAGAAGGDAGHRLWTLGEGSLSWAQYRFGDVPGV